MTTKVPKNKITMVFHRETDDQLVTTMGAVDEGVYGHPEVFTGMLVDKATYQAQRGAYSASVIAAKDGGKKAIAEKNKQKSLSTKMLSKIARNVQELANNDLTILTLSGFTVTTGSLPPQPTGQPEIDKLKQTASGEITATPTPVTDVGVYQLQCGALGPGGTPPASWVTIDIRKSKPGAVFKNLIPGTMYAFQVRAFGNSGWTGWSEVVTKMST